MTPRHIPTEAELTEEDKRIGAEMAKDFWEREEKPGEMARTHDILAKMQQKRLDGCSPKELAEYFKKLNTQMK